MRARPQCAVLIGGGACSRLLLMQLRACFCIGCRGRTGYVIVIHVVQVIVRFVGCIDVRDRLGLAAASEVESIDAGAQVGAISFGARVSKHAHARLSGSPADARQLSDIAPKICNLL